MYEEIKEIKNVISKTGEFISIEIGTLVFGLRGTFGQLKVHYEKKSSKIQSLHIV